MKRSNEIPPNGIPIVAGIFAVALSWFLFHAIIWAIHGSVIDAGRLVGPDSYMRLVRVEELLNGTGWFNDVIARANAPYGDQLHWTRPFLG